MTTPLTIEETLGVIADLGAFLKNAAVAGVPALYRKHVAGSNAALRAALPAALGKLGQKWSTPEYVEKFSGMGVTYPSRFLPAAAPPGSLAGMDEEAAKAYVWQALKALPPDLLLTVAEATPIQIASIQARQAPSA